MQKVLPHTFTKTMIKELDKRRVGNSSYLIISRMLKRIEEIRKEIKSVLQNSTTEKEDKRGEERDMVAAEACLNTCSIQEEGTKPMLIFPEKGIWSHFRGGKYQSTSNLKKEKLCYHFSYRDTYLILDKWIALGNI